MRLWAAAVLFIVGCAGREVPDKRTDPARFAAVLARGLADPLPAVEPTRLVLFGEAAAVGVDPTSGEETWRRPIRVFGQPASYGRLVVAPVRGRRLVALDAETGRTEWEVRTPGEALTGIAISDRFVIVTALGDKKGTRSLIAGLAAVDGRRRWIRASATLVGVPAAAGRFGYVPVGDRVLAMRLRTGRVVTSLTPSANVRFERVERHGGTLLAAGPDAFLDLYDGGRTIYRVQSGGPPAFGRVEGMDPGLGHDDGVMFRLLPAKGAGAPRNALFLGRRALYFLRLDASGRPVQARWVHVRFDQREYVAMHATSQRILLVRDDGAVTHLDRRTGRLKLEVDGVTEPLGATFVGRDPYADDRDDPIDRETVVSTLLGVIEDPDPRLLPAQRLAIDLLWRDEAPDVRTHVADLSRGILRPDGGEDSEALRVHATNTMKGTWGRADEASVEALVKKLQPGAQGAIEDATREAVRSGDPTVIPKLVALLENPAVQPSDLVAIARALRDLDDTRALDGVCDFVVRYHADPDIVDESKAIYYALELIIAQALPTLPARVDEQARQRARQTLQTLLTDEFTVPQVRAFIQENLPYPDALQDEE